MEEMTLIEALETLKSSADYNFYEGGGNKIVYDGCMEAYEFLKTELAKKNTLNIKITIEYYAEGVRKEKTIDLTRYTNSIISCGVDDLGSFLRINSEIEVYRRATVYIRPF